MGVQLYCGFYPYGTNVNANTSTWAFWVDIYTDGGSHNNTGSARFSRTLTGDYQAYNENISIKIPENARTRIWTEEITVKHKADGTAKVHAETAVWTDISAGMVYANADMPATVIPRASSFTTNGGTTTGQTMTITIDKSNSSYTHTLTWKFGTKTGTIASKTSSSTVTWTPNTATFAQALTTNYYAIATITCETFNGSTSLGTTSQPVTIGLATTVKPTVGSVTLTDANGYYDTYDAYLTGKSSMNVAITASSPYGGTVKTLQVTFNGVTKSSTSGTLNASFGVLNIVGTKSLSIYVKDSRGRTTTTSESVTWTNREPPTLVGSYVKRWSSGSTSGTESETGTYGRVHVDGKINGGKSGSGTLVVKYGAATASSLTQYTSRSVSTATFSYDFFIPNLSSETRYKVEITFTDELGIATTFTGYVETESAIMDFRYNGQGLAIGKISEQNAFEVAMPSQFQNTVEFQDTVTFNGGTVTVPSLIVNGTTQLKDDVTVDSSALMKVNGQLQVGSTSTFASTATFSGQINANSYINAGGDIRLKNGISLSGATSSSNTSFTDIMYMSNGDLYLNWPAGGSLQGCVRKTIWTGTATPSNSTSTIPSSAKISIADHMRYNVFLVTIAASGTNQKIVAVRANKDSSTSYICGVGGSASPTYPGTIFALSFYAKSNSTSQWSILAANTFNINPSGTTITGSNNRANVYKIEGLI